MRQKTVKDLFHLSIQQSYWSDMRKLKINTGKINS